MASSREGSSIINFDDAEDKKPELEFQDFEHGDAATLEPNDYNSSFPISPDLENENAGLLSEEKRPASFWEFGYYQSFFDVDTDQVIQRIIWSMLPIKGRSTYIDRVIRPNPDLYGPIWISATLILSIAISANIADYLISEGKDKELWHYDFHKMSIVATAIYSYIFILPLALWGLMWYQPNMTKYTLLEMLCVYGYSLFIYIPISILWMIRIIWLQWLLVIVGASLSGMVLVHTFWPSIRDVNRKLGLIAVCLIMIFHALLAVGFVTYFFQPVHHVKVYENHVETTTIISAITEDKSKLVSDKLDKKNNPIDIKLPTNVANDTNVKSNAKRKTHPTASTTLLVKNDIDLSAKNDSDVNINYVEAVDNLFTNVSVMSTLKTVSSSGTSLTTLDVKKPFDVASTEISDNKI